MKFHRKVFFQERGMAESLIGHVIAGVYPLGIGITVKSAKRFEAVFPPVKAPIEQWNQPFPTRIKFLSYTEDSFYKIGLNFFFLQEDMTRSCIFIDYLHNSLVIIYFYVIIL